MLADCAAAFKVGSTYQELAQIIAAGFLRAEKMAADDLLAIINHQFGYGVQKKTFPQIVLVKMLLSQHTAENRLAGIAVRVKKLLTNRQAPPEN